MHRDPYGLTDMLKPTVNGMGFELWGIEYHHNSKNAILRIYIDHENGIKIDDCELISNQITGLLDLHDPIKVQYVLEVSSPGMDRLFFYPEQFKAYKNQKINFQLRSAVNNRRKFIGKVIESDDVTLQVMTEENEESFSVPIDNIHRASLVIDL